MTDSIRIDLGSDTATRPSAAMREAMARAPVGDEQLKEDPSVNTLCDQVADMLGKEAALFAPSGTMCNALAILTHCRAGDEIIAASASHIVSSEGAGAAALAGCFVHGIDTPDAIFGADAVHASVRGKSPKAPRSRLVEVEQTTNRGGGAVWPLATIEEVCDAARQHNLSTHMDGARLMNAAVASNVDAADFARPFDSLFIDLSKGLGAPFGGVLAGSREFIEEAWVWKHRLGGSMRQAGQFAAAGVHALEHNIARLAEDHDNARLFAERISELPGVRLDPPTVQTNLVFFDVSGTGQRAPDIAKALAAQGVRIGYSNEVRMRACTHLDVSREDVEAAAAALAQVLGA